ncbi:MAG: hypothetical protein M1115_06035 [Actinobacteria bacterium]|jgi:hypothetical protein|nr:hypothetical protein [Actinomycetota bacterium]
MTEQAHQHHLDSEQRRTLHKLLGHPLPANIKWPQVLALLEAMGEVAVESKDRYRVTINDRTEVFSPPHHGDIPTDMVVKLRRFLGDLSVEPRRSSIGLHLLLVVNHHSATIYEFEPAAEHIGTIVPYDPEGHLRHLHHMEGHYKGQRAPEEPAYYRAIADGLKRADTVVIFGHGDGHSDAAKLVWERITKELQELPLRILIDQRVDAKALSEGELLAAARHLVESLEEPPGQVGLPGESQA